MDAERIGPGIALYTNPLIASPLLLGFYKSCIQLPTADMTPEAFRYTVLHELTHHKRHDLLFKWLVQIAICLHWFNPFVYWIGREIGRACELSCDEAVLSKLGVQERRSYGDTLLDAAKTGGGYKNAVASVTLCEGKALLSERLGAIMSYQKKSKAVLFVSLSLALLLLCGAVFAGAYRAPKGPRGSTAPDGLPLETAKAEVVTQIEKPHVAITIDRNAAVKLVPTTEEEITVSYGSTLYEATVANEQGNWQVHISYVGKYAKYPAAVLYLPEIAYGDVTMDIDQATVTFDGVFRSADRIDADMTLSSVFYTLPAGFTGQLNAAVPDSYLELRSMDDYENCDVSLQNCASLGEVAKRFTVHNSSPAQFGSAYANGTRAGVVRIDFQNTGYAVIE